MDMFGVFRENTDVGKESNENKVEFSQALLDKFDKIMGDDHLVDNEKTFREDCMQETSDSWIMDKFERLFEMDVESVESKGRTILDDSEDAIDKEINQPHEHNSEYKIGENIYETDDMGNTFKKNGEILPNSEYTLNGNTYRTDENGNKVSCDSQPEITEDGKRSISEQIKVGGEDRKEGDQGGHIIARILGGTEGEENLVPMRETINKGDYKKMENEIKRALEDGKQVELHVDLEYNESSRPTKIISTYMIDDRKMEVIFDNEKNSISLMEALDGKISEEKIISLNEEIADMKADGCLATITSVKTEFDENGRVEKVIVGMLDEMSGTKYYKAFDAC